jgi:hypothetical protein
VLQQSSTFNARSDDLIRELVRLCCACRLLCTDEQPGLCCRRWIEGIASRSRCME